MPTTKKPQLRLATQANDPNMNVLLYGPPKIGKTIGAVSAPGPLLHVNAERPNATRLAHEKHVFDEVAFEGLETMIAVINAAKAGKYRSIVIDPIGEVYSKLVDELTGNALRAQIQLRGDAGVHLLRFIHALCDLPVNAIFVAHEMPVFEGEDSATERIPLMTSKSGSPVFAAKVMAVVDVIGYTGIQREDDSVKYMAQLIDGGGRHGGSRWPVLGDTAELNLKKWDERIRSDQKEPAKGVKGAA